MYAVPKGEQSSNMGHRISEEIDMESKHEFAQIGSSG